MGKRKRKLSSRERAAKKERNREFMTIFINGKQKRVRREPTIDGIPHFMLMQPNRVCIPPYEFINREYMQEEPNENQSTLPHEPWDEENEIPF